MTVLVPIHAGHNDDDGLSVRCNFRVRDTDDFLEVAQRYLSSLRLCPTRHNEGKEQRQVCQDLEVYDKPARTVFRPRPIYRCHLRR